MNEGLIVNGMVDYYELFGVDDGEETAHIKKAWRAMSKELHPDLQGMLLKLYHILVWYIGWCCSCLC